MSCSTAGKVFFSTDSESLEKKMEHYYWLQSLTVLLGVSNHKEIRGNCVELVRECCEPFNYLLFLIIPVRLFEEKTCALECTLLGWMFLWSQAAFWCLNFRLARFRLDSIRNIQSCLQIALYTKEDKRYIVYVYWSLTLSAEHRKRLITLDLKTLFFTYYSMIVACPQG